MIIAQWPSRPTTATVTPGSSSDKRAAKLANIEKSTLMASAASERPCRSAEAPIFTTFDGVSAYILKSNFKRMLCATL